MRLLLLLALAAPLAAQPIPLAPYGGPPGGNVEGLEVTPSGTIIMIQDERLFVSQDEGATWTMPIEDVRFGSLNKTPTDTLVARATLTEVYVSVDGIRWHPHPEPTSRALWALRTEDGWFVIDTSKVYRSIDDGTTWALADAGIDPKAYEERLAVSSDGQLLLTTSTYWLSGGEGSRVYAWQDTAWVERPLDGCPRHARIGQIMFTPSGAGIALLIEDYYPIGSWDIRRTTLFTPNGGDSWSCSGSGVVSVAAGADGRLYRAMEGGESTSARIEFSVDGTNWARLGLEGVTTTTMRFLPDGTLLAGSGRFMPPDAYEELHGSGLYRLDSQGESTWLRPAAATSVVVALETIEGTLYAVSPNGIWRREATGWEAVEAVNLSPFEWPGMPGYTRLTSLTQAPWGTRYYSTSPLAIPTKQGAGFASGIAALGDSTLLVSSGQPMRSTNRGATWDWMDLPAEHFLEVDDGLLAAGEGVWHSADLGATWSQVWRSDTLRIHSFASNGLGGGRHTYALVDNYRIEPFLMRSVGVAGPAMTWEPVPGSHLPVRNAWSSQLLLTADQRLFFASELALHVSSDEGVTWEKVFEADPGRVPFHATTSTRSWPFTLDADGYLIVAGESGGLLRSTVRVAAQPDRHVASRGVLAVWPNPASGIVQIAPGAAEGHIDLFDLLGRRVARVADGALAETVSWDASTLSPGLYFMRLSKPTGTQSAPLVVVR